MSLSNRKRGLVWPWVMILLAVSLVAPESKTVQGRIENKLEADGYKIKFEYDFKRGENPDDFQGHQIWDQNLWTTPNLRSDEMSISEDFASFSTSSGTQNRVGSASLATWSKSEMRPLAKFHFGYFDARMRFDVWPENAWPAFWLESTKRPLLGGLGKVSGDWCEIDIFEGGQKRMFNATVHDWHEGISSHNENSHMPIRVPSSFSEWHDYGALWDHDNVKFYFDGVEVGETQTPKICQEQDVFIIIGAQSRNESLGRVRLDVQRVRVFQE